jgi:hypothetical protein
MVQSDHDLLIEMGFDAERVKLAVAKTKGRTYIVRNYSPVVGASPVDIATDPIK